MTATAPTTTPPTAPATTLPPEQAAKVAKSAQDFEAMALTQLLAPIFDSVDASKGPFGGGQAEAAWKPMMTAELAKHLAAHGGRGLARPVMQQMLRMQEAAQQGAGAGP